MNLNDHELYIKIIALDEIYNFVVEKFFIWRHLDNEIFILKFTFDISIENVSHLNRIHRTPHAGPIWEKWEGR